MALIECPECNKDIDENAFYCHHCGIVLRDDEIVIDYRNSKGEFSKRQISNISSKVNQTGNKYIQAYCHLRDGVKTFYLANILEISINGKKISKDEFYNNNIRDKNQNTRRKR